jgi:RHS repeat-associated protein
VTVNSSAADYRRGEYFQEAVSVVNTTSPVWQNVAVTASQSGSSSNWPAGSVFVPRTGELFGHDTDGNLTSDGRWAYTWDGENRLVRMVANTAVGPQQRLDFEYDWQGRRIRKVVWPNTGGTGTPTANLLFVYDGWNLVAELNATNKTVIRSYVWGLDLSGSEQGAGGVGGLLAVKPGNGVAQFAAYDGNGNVTALVDGTTGTYTARYEYGPFGEPIRVSGTHGSGNPFRFSTKFTDDETGLVYYGFRYYNPSTGRWVSRDPIGERGGRNLYGFVRSNSVGLTDPLGLATASADSVACGNCGPDVTATTLRTIQEIESTFRFTWSVKQRWNACTALYGRYANGAWTIMELFEISYHGTKLSAYPRLGASALPGTVPDCGTTVVYNGKCHHAGDVNYLMWGKINTLCWRQFGFTDPDEWGPWTLNWAVTGATAWKLWKHWDDGDPLTGNLAGAIGFTVAGYVRPLGGPQPNEFKQCQIRRGNRCTSTRFAWHWWPEHAQATPVEGIW